MNKEIRVHFEVCDVCGALYRLSVKAGDVIKLDVEGARDRGAHFHSDENIVLPLAIGKFDGFFDFEPTRCPAHIWAEAIKEKDGIDWEMWLHSKFVNVIHLSPFSFNAGIASYKRRDYTDRKGHYPGRGFVHMAHAIHSLAKSYPDEWLLANDTVQRVLHALEAEA